MSKVLSLQHGVNIKIINEIVYILLFVQSLWGPECVWYLQFISVWTSHIASAQQHLWLVATLSGSLGLEFRASLPRGTQRPGVSWARQQDLLFCPLLMTHLKWTPGETGLKNQRCLESFVLDGNVCSLEPALAVGLPSWPQMPPLTGPGLTPGSSQSSLSFRSCIESGTKKVCFAG